MILVTVCRSALIWNSRSHRLNLHCKRVIRWRLSRSAQFAKIGLDVRDGLDVDDQRLAGDTGNLFRGDDARCNAEL